MTIPRLLGLLARGWDERSLLDELTVEGDPVLPPVPQERVLHLSVLGQDAEPLVCLALGGQFRECLKMMDGELPASSATWSALFTDAIR
jgi:hypothetical protein